MAVKRALTGEVQLHITKSVFEPSKPFLVEDPDGGTKLAWAPLIIDGAYNTDSHDKLELTFCERSLETNENIRGTERAVRVDMRAIPAEFFANEALVGSYGWQLMVAELLFVSDSVYYQKLNSLFAPAGE